MVKWLPFSLLIAIVLAALPGPNAGRCASTMTARMLGCSDTAPVVVADAGCCAKPRPAPAPKPAPQSSACCAPAQPVAALPCADAPDAGCASDAADPGACTTCMVVCGTLCDESFSWALLGLASDGLSHVAPSVLLAQSEWLPRPASASTPSPALVGEWLTVDRPRRQARLCLWTV